MLDIVQSGNLHISIGGSQGKSGMFVEYLGSGSVSSGVFWGGEADTTSWSSSELVLDACLKKKRTSWWHYLRLTGIPMCLIIQNYSIHLQIVYFATANISTKLFLPCPAQIVEIYPSRLTTSLSRCLGFVWGAPENILIMNSQQDAGVATHEIKAWTLCVCITWR